MTDKVNGDSTPKLDSDRKMKVFNVAKKLKSNVYKLRTIWFDDVDKWGLICTARIGDQLYDAANYLDDYTSAQHADMFRAAFSDALADAEKEKKSIITLH